MSSDQNPTDEGIESTTDPREQFAHAFNRPVDPLAEYSDTFSQLPDPFEYFMDRVVENRERITSDGTYENYRRTYDQWSNHVSPTGRHPACPNVDLVKSFIDWRRDVHGNARETILIKLSHLNQAYEHWQRESVFPHPNDYNPFAIAREETSLGGSSAKPFPDLTLEDLREVFADIDNIRARALIGLQLKHGLRAGEVTNLELRDIHLSHSGLQKVYPDLGTHDAIGDYTDVLYVSSERDGNKSNVPRLLPIDDELRWLLSRYLLTRPQTGEPQVFFSTVFSSTLSHTGINQPWKDAFHPEYEGTEERRAITSHFGRHWFSSYWRLEAGLQREHVQYMRGDRIEPIDSFADAIDDYLHPNFEHIESTYRNQVFKISLQ
mgnify:CR=1 FL=1